MEPQRNLAATKVATALSGILHTTAGTLFNICSATDPTVSSITNRNVSDSLLSQTPTSPLTTGGQISI